MKKILVLIVTLAALLQMTESLSAAADLEKIKIGFAFPMSGSAAMAGRYSSHGAQVIEKELNGKITIQGKEYDVEFIYMDTEGS